MAKPDLKAPKRRTNRALVMASVLAAMFMVAIEVTIVATAMPQIVADLGGIQLYSWVFASFLLTQTSATVVFGKLSDVFGRKPVILTGIAVFLVGSVMCGLAWSMPAMIAFRLVQGIGAGAVQPVALTIVADIFPGRERGRVQGYLASVWAISAVLGPIVGGFLVRDFSWSWIFWMNVPLGLLASLGFIILLHEDVHSERKPIDIPGALLFAVCSGSLMVFLTSLATARAVTSLSVLAIFIVSALLFVAQERRAIDPMISFKMWGRRAIAATNGVAILANMALMGLTSFLPMYVQAVLHRSPITAGLALTMMMVGWPTGATIAAKTTYRFGLRCLLFGGSCLIPVGGVTFILLTPASSPALAGLGSLIMGFGMGLVSVSSLMLIQEVVERHERGSATASNMFSRNLGSALGATLLGAVLNFGIGHLPGGKSVRIEEIQHAFPAQKGARQVFDPALDAALQHALHETFLAMFVISILIVLVSAAVPVVTIGRLKPAEDERDAAEAAE